jgi:Ca-activated chloride channel family protein
MNIFGRKTRAQFKALALAAVAMMALSMGCGDLKSANESFASDNILGTANNSYGAPGYPSGADVAAPPENYQQGENYQEWVENEFIDTAEENTSTFSIDVDTASYTLMRRDLLNETLPVPEGVRPEEYINYFDYDYPQPDGDAPFSINLEVAPSKFGADGHKLVRVGLQGKDISIDQLKPTSLVFLIDVSGSMQSANKLPMVKESLYTLLEYLRPTDTVGIVVYAGAEGIVLEPTEVRHRDLIERAIENLSAGGSTNGEAGIVAAYQMAEQAKIEGGNNRVIILTDGDFNVGKTGDALVQLVRDYRDKHISLTSVGYGLGNYNDATMEALARDGNGNYFYVDSQQEAERIFGTDLTSVLEVIASDVKIQVEFNPASVARYRLIGYENRIMENEDFDDDTKDAGEIGPGHTVTALYEIELAPQAASTSFLTSVRVRYKPQYGAESILLEHGIKMAEIRDDFAAASPGFRFAAAVAEFAEILRHSQHSSDARFDEIRSIALGASTADEEPKREFIQLVDLARNLWNQAPQN